MTTGAAFWAAALLMERTARTISRMWSGVVPQQPPMIRAPISKNRLAYSAMYSGVHM